MLLSRNDRALLDPRANGEENVPSGHGASSPRVCQKNHTPGTDPPLDVSLSQRDTSPRYDACNVLTLAQEEPNMDTAIRLHEKIVEDIQVFEPVSAIRQGIACMRDLVDPDAGSAAIHSDIKPEDVMLVMRWVFQYQELGKGTHSMSANDMGRLSRDVSKLRALAEDEKTPAFGPHDWPRIDYHRRPYEDSRFETGPSVPRQMILFRDMLEGSELSASFSEKHQISLHTFILIYTWCCAHVYVGKSLSVREIRPKWKEGNSFLNAVARDFKGASDWVRKVSAQTDIQGNPQRSLWRQLREPSPLVRIPLFRDGDSLVPYSLGILEAGLRGNLYEMFEDLGGGFPDGDFSAAYSKYIQGLVQKLRLSFLGDESLTETVGSGSSRADCVVLDGKTVVIVEVKSTTPPLKEMAEQDFIGAGGSAKRRLLKGITQIAHTAVHLNIPSKSDVIGIVVTYGKYEHTWETIGEKARGDVQKKLDCLGNPILTHQCFFLDIDDFEHLVDAALEPNMGFGKMLHQLATQQQNKGDQFAFKKELEHLVGRPLPTPDWLMKRMDAWMREIAPPGAL